MAGFWQVFVWSFIHGALARLCAFQWLMKTCHKFMAGFVKEGWGSLAPA
jgi:hypothetical protein